MAESLISRKLAHMFRRFDANGSGAVDKADFDHALGVTAKRIGAAPGTPVHQKLQSAYHLLWSQVQACDLDGNGEVNLTEWIQSWTFMADPKNYEATIGVASPQIFDCVDADGSGVISDAEFCNWLCGFGVTDAVAREAFHKQDRDGDNTISKSEMMANVREFFTSEDANATGNWLFGAGF